MGSVSEESNDTDFEIDDEQFTDTDLFDPEAIARELESRGRAIAATSNSARNRIEEMVERKRLERELLDYDDPGGTESNWAE